MPTQATVTATDIIGIWYMPNSQGQEIIVEIFEMNNKFYANGIAVRGQEDTPRELDTKNPDPAFHNRTRNQIIFIYDLEFNGKTWVNGEIYDLYNGEYFFISVEHISDTTLKLRASLDKRGMLGVTQTWTRSSNPEKYEYLKNSREFLAQNLPTIRHKI